MNYEWFRHYKDDIYVSDYGYVRKNDEELPWHKDEKYYYVCVNGESLRIHNLVGEVFQDICGEHKEGYHLHHKNGNPLDNRAVNLVWLSPSEHKKQHLQEDEIPIPVKAYDLNGNFVGRWDSMLEAATSKKTDRRHISENVNGKKSRLSVNGFVYVKADATEDEIKTKLKQAIDYHKKKETNKTNKEERKRLKEIKREEKRIKAEKDKIKRVERRKILEYNANNDFVKEWDDIETICQALGLTRSAIYSNLCKRTVYVKKGGVKRYFVKKNA